MAGMTMDGVSDSTPFVTPKKPYIGDKDKKTLGRDQIIINPDIPNTIKQRTEQAMIAATATRSMQEQAALAAKAEFSDIPLEILETVYERGIQRWFEQHDHTHTAQQYAFSRVSSFINRGKAWNEDADLCELYRSTLGSYIAKATKADEKLQGKLLISKGWKYDQYLRTSQKRRNGVKLAAKKLSESTNSKFVGLNSTLSKTKTKPEHLIPHQTRVRTRMGGYVGIIKKVHKHPERDYMVHFTAQNGKRYKTGIENVVMEQAEKPLTKVRRSKENIAARKRYKPDPRTAIVKKALATGSFWAKKLKEEAPGADIERQRLLKLHAKLKRIFKTIHKNNVGQVSESSFYSVRDKTGATHYIGHDYNEALRVRRRYGNARLHRHRY